MLAPRVDAAHLQRQGQLLLRRAARPAAAARGRPADLSTARRRRRIAARARQLRPRHAQLRARQSPGPLQSDRPALVQRRRGVFRRRRSIPPKRVKTADELAVELPTDNLDFQQLRRAGHGRPFRRQRPRPLAELPPGKPKPASLGALRTAATSSCPSITRSRPVNSTGKRSATCTSRLEAQDRRHLDDSRAGDLLRQSAQIHRDRPGRRRPNRRGRTNRKARRRRLPGHRRRSVLFRRIEDQEQGFPVRPARFVGRRAAAGHSGQPARRCRPLA